MSSIAASQLDILAPLATPLPEAPGDQFFTDDQWTTLMAIMDTVIPSIRRETAAKREFSQLTLSDVEYNAAIDHLKKNVVNAPDGESFDDYLEERPSDNAGFQDLLKRSLIHYTRDDARKGLAFILSALK